MAKIPNKLDFLLNEASFLLLEDMVAFRTQLIGDLRAKKIKGPIHEAGTLMAAYDVLNKQKIDFIICDWNLPDGTGYDFLVAVKKMPLYKSTPFVMWTTMNEVNHIISAISAGANEYFCKPWTPDEAELKIMQAWGKIHGTT